MDHYRLFKELPTTFFSLSSCTVLPRVGRNVAGFAAVLDKEIFTDVTHGEKHQADIVARAAISGESLVSDSRRAAGPAPDPFPAADVHLFRPFPPEIPCRSILSPCSPTSAAGLNRHYSVDFPDLKVLAFQFRVVQLSRLKWRDFLDRMNPIVAALMSNMAMSRSSARW